MNNKFPHSRILIYFQSSSLDQIKKISLTDAVFSRSYIPISIILTDCSHTVNISTKPVTFKASVLKHRADVISVKGESVVQRHKGKGKSIRRRTSNTWKVRVVLYNLCIVNMAEYIIRCLIFLMHSYLREHVIVETSMLHAPVLVHVTIKSRCALDHARVLPHE